MSRIPALLLSVGLALALTACGDDEASPAPESPSSSAAAAEPTPSAEPVEATSEPTGSTGALPTYDEVKALYLADADETTQQACADSPDDVDVPAADGETYTRFVCSDLERFDYVAGAATYADNYESLVAGDAYKSVFHVPGELVVSPAGSNEDLAPAIQQACGCGEVVEVILE